MLNLLNCKALISYNRDVQDKIFYLRPGFGDKNIATSSSKNKISILFLKFNLLLIIQQFSV